MAAKPQVTALLKADATGVQTALRGAKKHFAGFAADVGRKMKAAAVAGMAGAAAGLTAALKNGFDQKVMLEQSETLMKSLMGGAEKARAAMEMLGDEAKQNPMFSKKQMIEAGTALANFAGGSVEKLRSLTETSQKLSLLNPSQGIEGAAYALKEALGGDYVSLAERFNISKSQIKNLREAGYEGQRLVDAILKQQGITDETMGEMGNTMGGQIAKLKSMWDEISLKLVEGFWPRIQQTAEQFMNWIMENKDQIIEVLTTATEVAIKLFQWAVTGFNWVRMTVEQLAAFFGGWWAEISTNFSLERFVSWLTAMIDAGMSLIQGAIAKVIAWALGKLKELSPKLFGWIGGDNLINKFNEIGDASFQNASDAGNRAFEASGMAEGRRQADIVRAEQAAAAEKPKQQTAVLRIDAQGYNGVPRMMGAS